MEVCFDRQVPPVTTSSTRAALLSAAESLFGSDGYDNVSVRAICAAADANPAAVHYHFGSKDRLTIELLETRLGPRWSDPLDRFDPHVHDVGDLVDVILQPFVDIQRDRTGQLHLQLLNRFTVTHPDAQWNRPWFRLDRWSEILTTLMPDLSPDDARRRWALAFGLILSGFGGEHPLHAPAVDALADFVVGGLTTASRSAHPTARRPPTRRTHDDR